MAKRALLLALLSLGAVTDRALAASSWTPANADLLFTSGRDGDSEVYLLPAGQKDWINLSNNSAGDNWPIWAPDGKWIVFQSNRTGNLDIWKMRADGSGPVQLTSDPEPDYLPSWSPDGKTILFTSWRQEKGDEKRAPHIYAMNPDGSAQRRLVRTSTNTSEGATWSPDGKQIVYSRKGEKGADIFVADADGTNERQITKDQDRNIYNGSSTFSPDGKLIAFYSDDEKTAALTVIGAGGDNRRTVVAEGHNWYPRWSPDGLWLVYTAPASSEDKANMDVFAVSVDGKSPPVRLIGSPKRDQEASWRPR